MKIFLFILVAFSTGYLFLAATFADTETNSVYSKIEKAAISNDVQTVLQVLPDVEKLWPQEPEAYFRSARQAAKALGEAQNNPDAKHSLLTLFENILQKPCPTNDEQAVSCFDNKQKAIRYYFNFKEVRNDKSQLIAIANFVGEIRSRMIPNYAYRAQQLPGREILEQARVMSPSKLTDPALKRAYDKAVEQNEQNKIMDRLQSALRSANWAITSHLLHNCSRFSSGDQKNDDFIKEIVSSAKLTEDETKKMLVSRPSQTNSQAAINETATNNSTK